MKDVPLIEKRLVWVVESVERLRRLAKPERIHDDPVQRAFVEHTLQTAIQAMIDVASAIVSEQRLGEPRTTSDLFALLAQAGWLPRDHVDVLRRVVGFRNVVIHRYVDVDPAIVRGIVESHLEDLLDFVRVIRDRLEDEGER